MPKTSTLRASRLFAQGQLDEGIERVDTAAQATGLPRYAERLQTMIN